MGADTGLVAIETSRYKEFIDSRPKSKAGDIPQNQRRSYRYSGPGSVEWRFGNPSLHPNRLKADRLKPTAVPAI